MFSSYALVFGSLLMLAGRAGDLFGRRRFVTSGVALFALALLGCAVAPTQAILLLGGWPAGAGRAQ